MAVSFVRQLGAESGVQLNPLQDRSEIPGVDNSDQAFGIMMRSTRGRIDKPFCVDTGNIYSKLGRGEPIRVNAINEAWVHVFEALNNGAYQAVVQRLVTDNAKIYYAVAKKGKEATLKPTVTDGELTSIEVVDGGSGYDTAPTIRFNGAGSGAQVEVTLNNGAIATVAVTEGGSGYNDGLEAFVDAPVSFTVTETDPATQTDEPYLFAIKHLDCYNDGIKVAFRAEESRDGGIKQPASEINLLIRDSENVLLYEFKGSLDPDALDAYGNAYYLPDVIRKQTDALEMTVGCKGDDAKISPDSIAYGYDDNGIEKWAQSGVLHCFDEGGTDYSLEDYRRARMLLYQTPFDYAYISSGGTQSSAMLGQLSQLAYDTNRQLRYDIPGNLTPEAAIAFAEQLNLDTHLAHAFWSPISSDDPAGLNPSTLFGVATLNIAMACGRNAQTNAYGFAPKNYPVAGHDWPVTRGNMRQLYQPSNQELNLLAKAHINPVLYETYSDGGRYVFRDSLTSSKADSKKKLIAVVDMSTSVDDAMTKFSKRVLQYPMSIAVKRVRDFAQKYFEQAEASGWLVAGTDPQMAGRTFQFEAKPSEIRPFDELILTYWVCYDGTTRAVKVTQTITK